MYIVYERAAVRVPATTADMRPGFDSFDIISRYYDEIPMRPVTGITRVIVKGADAETVPTNDDSLVVQALRAGLDAVGAPQAGFEMRCVNRIPHDGGIGPSASAAVAGLMLACGLVAEPEAPSDDRILALATDFEDHPDNVMPTVFEGTTTAWVKRRGCLRMVSMSLDAPLGVSLLIPPATTRLSTKEARQVLPIPVSRGDALSSTSRAAILILAFTGRPDPFMAGTEGRLHQEYRRGVLPTSMAVMDSLREQGYPVVISGAGLTMLVLPTPADRTRFALENYGWNVLSPGIDTCGAVLTS